MSLNLFDRKSSENSKFFLSGLHEGRILGLLESLGYKESFDFFHQYPIFDKYFLDFAFPSMKLNIEIDGNDHKQVKKKNKDKERDSLLRENNWRILRITHEKIEENPLFVKYLISEVLQTLLPIV